MNIQFRQAQVQDLEACLLIQSLAHLPQFHEEDKTFVMFLTAGFSWIAQADGRVIAYALVHPWNGLDWPCIGATEIPTGPDQWWHDMAVHPDFQGQGIVKIFMETILNAAPRTGGAALAHKVRYWMSKGFEAVDVSLDPAYGSGAQALVYSRK